MIRRLILSLFVIAVLTCVGFAGWMIAYATRPIPLPSTPFQFTIKQGSSLKSAVSQITASGLDISPWRFEWLARGLGRATDLKAGTYQLNAPVSPLQMLEKLRTGEALLSVITFVEGVTFAQMRKQLAAQAAVKSESAGLADQSILAAIGATEKHPEGLFFPDTYAFNSGTSDLTLLKRAYQNMQAQLAKAWETRAAGLPYASPYEALIMASIVEKETGNPDERSLVAAVFVNRLKRNLKLQADPTVIYGLGDRFNGNLRKQDLTADTVYNTYTRTGLPPTPIAMPGLKSIEAALNPAPGDYLYFVSRKDGSHHFSRTLEEHNRAVARYQK